MARAIESRFTPQLESAIAEIQELIASRYPAATFEISDGEDPDGIYLGATVDVADMGDVVDLFLDRLVELQVEEGLPLFVVPVRPVDRVSPNCAAARRWRCRLRCRSVEGRNHGTAAHSFGNDADRIYRFSAPATAALTPGAMSLPPVT
jgi:hypothetical protein